MELPPDQSRKNLTQQTNCWKGLHAQLEQPGYDKVPGDLYAGHARPNIMTNHTHCSQKPVADSEDNQMTPVLNKKSPGVHQHQLCILQWNANGIHRQNYHFWKISLKLLMRMWFASKRRSCSQKIRHMNSETSVCPT